MNGRESTDIGQSTWPQHSCKKFSRLIVGWNPFRPNHYRRGDRPGRCVQRAAPVSRHPDTFRGVEAVPAPCSGLGIGDAGGLEEGAGYQRDYPRERRGRLHDRVREQPAVNEGAEAVVMLIDPELDSRAAYPAGRDPGYTKANL